MQELKLRCHDLYKVESTVCKERAGEWQKALQLFWELAGKGKLDIIAAWNLLV